MPPITVVIASHERASRAACLGHLQSEKGIRVVAEARSGLEALAVVRLKPHILVLDLSLFRGNGLLLLPVLRQRSPRTKVILLVGRVSEARILEALCQGALGYLGKEVLRAFLAKAIRAVEAGQAWVPRKMVGKITDRLLVSPFGKGENKSKPSSSLKRD